MVAIAGPWGRLAPSLVALVEEADRLAPNRSRASDGSVGDLAHASRSSFHNPEDEVVDAVDLTHDPARGFDAHAKVREIVARGDDRLDHVISDGEIWSEVKPYWRTYTGPNPHTKHAHIAVKRNAAGRRSTAPWWPTGSPTSEEDDMPLTESDVIAIADEIGRRFEPLAAALGRIETAVRDQTEGLLPLVKDDAEKGRTILASLDEVKSAIAKLAG